MSSAEIGLIIPDDNHQPLRGCSSTWTTWKRCRKVRKINRGLNILLTDSEQISYGWLVGTALKKHLISSSGIMARLPSLLRIRFALSNEVLIRRGRILSESESVSDFYIAGSVINAKPIEDPVQKKMKL